MSLVIRYGLLGVAVSAAFVNFISCGSQMYQASLEGDHSRQENNEVGEANSKDPNSPEFGLHAPSGWVSLPVVYNVEKNFSKVQLQALKDAMATWETAVGKKLFEFKSIDSKTGDSFPDLFSSLEDGLNGHYDNNNWKKTGKKTQVLATTIWQNTDSYQQISGADIHYNSENYYIADAASMTPKDDREIVDMQSLALHELGHLLGLAHVDAKIDSSSIMNPSLYIGAGLTTRALSVGDVQRIQKIYGCEGKACKKEEIAREILLSTQKKTAASNSNNAH
ncbi:MAG: matrixin family metalloprotease [Proteobacteria bacterium]|nr:matrixin family metalloprotease [Pseudomonadota bacterium]